MTGSAMAGLRRDIQEIFGRNRASIPAACEQARDRLAAFPVPDPEVPEYWDDFEALTGQLRVLLGYLAEAGVSSTEPAEFRSVVLADLHYLYVADVGRSGRTLAGGICRKWTAELGVEHPDRISAYERYAALCLSIGTHDEAVRLLRSMHKLRTRLSGPRSSATLSVAASLCDALDQAGTISPLCSSARTSSRSAPRCLAATQIPLSARSAAWRAPCAAWAGCPQRWERTAMFTRSTCVPGAQIISRRSRQPTTRRSRPTAWKTTKSPWP